MWRQECVKLSAFECESERRCVTNSDNLLERSHFGSLLLLKGKHRY